MKYLRLATLSLAAAGMFALAGTGTALANGAGLGLSNAASPHNFATEAWNHRAEICRVCHVPHDHDRAAQFFTNGLLWNHEVSAQTFTMYSSASIDGAQSAQPDGTAKLCLGCHDGTVAIDEFDNKAIANGGAGGTVFMGAVDSGFVIPGASVTPSLQGTHPISIVYDNVADNELRAPTSTMGTSGTIADVLDGGKVQCSTCHDVHDSSEAVAGTHLLRVAQTVAQGGSASGLCLTCHIK